jgi:predicted ATPase
VEHSDIQKALQEQYTGVLRRLAEQHPLLLILDDFQWADLGSISLLFHLCRRLGKNKILLAVAYRSDELALGRSQEQHPLLPVITELKRKYGDIEIDLDQADENEGRNFINSLINSEPNRLGEAFRQSLYYQTGGHPLFTIELLRQFQEGSVLQKDTRGRWFESGTVQWRYLPAKVEAIIEGRVSRLPADLREILRVASVEGVEFTADVIAEVLGSPLPKIISALSARLDRHYLLVKAVGVQRVGQRRLSAYVFRHHLFQKYLYDSLDDVERAYLHDRVGLSLEELHEDDKEIAALRLAWHFEEANNIEKAVDYLQRAGEQAKLLSANQDAISLFRRGISLVSQVSDYSTRFQKELTLQISLGAPLVAANGWSSPEVEVTYDRARHLCEEAGMTERLAPVLWGLWSYYLVRVQLDAARQQADKLLKLAQELEDPVLLLVANWTLGITLVHSGDIQRARLHLTQAVGLYDSERHEPLTYLYGQNPGVTCLIYLAITLWYGGFPNLALTYIHQAEEIADSDSHLFSRSFAHGMIALFHSTRREADLTLQHALRAVSLASEGQFPFIFGLGLTLRGWALAQLGKSKNASKLIRRGLAAMRETGAELGRPLLLYLLAEVYIKEQKYTEGLEMVEEALELATVNGELLNRADLLRLQGAILAMQGAGGPTIRKCFTESVEVAAEQGALIPELRGELARASYERDQGISGVGLERITALLKQFNEGFDTIDLREAREFIDRI